MGAVEIVTAFNATMNAQQWDVAAGYLTDDFTFSGTTPQPLGKQAFLATQQQWLAGVPDWHVMLESLREEGNTVQASVRITGTQTNTLTLPGQPALPATGKHFSVVNSMSAAMRGERIAAITAVPGSPGIFEQLGVQ